MTEFQIHVRTRDLEHRHKSLQRPLRLILCFVGLVSALACLVLILRTHENNSGELKLSLEKRKSVIQASHDLLIKSKAQLHAVVKNLQTKENSNAHDKPAKSVVQTGTHPASPAVAQKSTKSILKGGVVNNEADEQKIKMLEDELRKVKTALSRSSTHRKQNLQSMRPRCENGAEGCLEIAKNVSDGDDFDEDRDSETFLHQVLRLPMVYHLVRTLDHYLPDQFLEITNDTISANNESHTVRLFDDDRIANIEPRESTPMPVKDRGPEYYPGGDFADRFRSQDQPQARFLEGGFDDSDVKVNNESLVINITQNLTYLTGESNFHEVADDSNIEMLPPVARHPRKHLGTEYDAGGAMADMLRTPDYIGDPLDRDEYIHILPPKPVAARPPRDADTDLDFVDSVLPSSEASLPTDDALLRMLGLPSAIERNDGPVDEYEFKYGMMAGFPDRDVNEPLLDEGAKAIAEKYDSAADARDVETREEGYAMDTVPMEEDDAPPDEIVAPPAEGSA